MHIRRSTVVILASALAACADIPQGPALSYENLLVNTHENPKWARSAWQTQSQQAAAQQGQQPPAKPAPSAPAPAPDGTAPR